MNATPWYRQGGFTLIELMIVIAIIAILLSLLFGFIGVGSTNAQWGINGLTETRCIDGYTFVIGARGQPTQVLDSFGKGVPCHPNKDQQP